MLRSCDSNDGPGKTQLYSASLMRDRIKRLWAEKIRIAQQPVAPSALQQAFAEWLFRVLPLKFHPAYQFHRIIKDKLCFNTELSETARHRLIITVEFIPQVLRARPGPSPIHAPEASPGAEHNLLFSKPGWANNYE